MERDLVALAVMTLGVILFFYAMSLRLVWESLLILISSIGVAYAVVASGEKEARIKQMEAKIRELEEAQKTDKQK